MDVFVFGANGYIGSAVIRELKAHGHAVTALTTRKQAAEDLTKQGFRAITGKMQAPKPWISAAMKADAIIQLADTFDKDAGKIETEMLEALEETLQKRKRKMRIIYTGGCWLYGNTGDEQAIEGHEFAPIKAFKYCVKNRNRLMKSDHFDAIAIHPAMVWDRDGGVLRDMLDAVREGKPIQVVNGPETRWPMVHRDDLAVLYRLALEKGTPGKDYHGAAGNAVSVDELAHALARRVAAKPIFDIISEEQAVAQHGEWARGYGLDHQMSAKRTMFELGWRPAQDDIIRELNPYGPR
jgi:nucleoside-diphosphate-sugar epimerase